MRLPSIFTVMFLFCSTLPARDKADLAPKEKDMRPWGTTVEGLRLSLACAKREYAAKDPVEVHVVLQNVSAKSRTIVHAHTLLIYNVSVVGPSGKEIPMTPRGKEIVQGAAAGIMGTRVVKPGEELSRTLELGQVFDIGMQGDYKITLSRLVPNLDDEKKFSTLTSNTISIRILKDK